MPNYLNATSPLTYFVTSRVATTYVDLDVAKEHLNIYGDNAQDDLITSYLETAQGLIEGIIGQELFPTTFQANYTMFDSGGLLLPRPKLESGTLPTVSYYDVNGMLQALPTSNFYLDPTTPIPVIYPLGSANINVSQTFQAPWVVSFVAVLPEAADATTGDPTRLRSAILMALGDLYSFRSSDDSKKLTDTTIATVERLLRKYRPATL